MSTKILFPQPPPTNNTLTPQQRTQLLRSTKKLGRILGSTPLLMDESPRPAPPVHVDLPFKFPGSKPKLTLSRPEKEITVILNRDGGHSPSTSISSSSSRDSSFDSSSISSNESTTSSHIEHINVTKPRRRPFLRLHSRPNPLASSRPTLETIPGSPSPYTLTHDVTINPTTTAHPPPTTYSPISPPKPRPVSSMYSPAFTIPSDASLRLAKMERLRKRLGDGVPVEMVFGHGDNKNDKAAGCDREVVTLTQQSSPSSSPTSITFGDDDSSTAPLSPRSPSFRSSKGLETIEEVHRQPEPEPQSKPKPRAPPESKWYDSRSAPRKSDKKKRKNMSDKDLWN